MSYNLKILRDYPIAYYPLNETEDGVLYDISGADNNGEVGIWKEPCLPLIPKGGSGKHVRYGKNEIKFSQINDYTGQEAQAPYGTYLTSKNPFSVEFWFKPNFYNPSYGYTPQNFEIIEDVGSIDPRISISLRGATLTLNLYDQDYNYHFVGGYINYTNKAIHVVATYSSSSISLYIDGRLCGTKSLPSNFKFYGGGGNNPVNFRVRPQSLYDSVFIDGIAVYRYELPYSSILSHYIEGNTQINPKQVAILKNGKFFDLNAAKLYESFIYTYPADKSLDSFIDTTNSEYIYYDEKNKCLKFNEIDSLVPIVLEDFIIIPEGIGISSKIEWRGDFGIQVETSIDGQSYQQCTNGDTIPQYKNGSYSSTGMLYIRVTMHPIVIGYSPDYEYFLPEFSFLSIVFYRDKKIYSDNGGGVLSLDTTSDASFGTINYPTLSRHHNNGIRIDGGFKIDCPSAINCIEMFFTPKENPGYPLPYYQEPTSTQACTLIYSQGAITTEYSWDSSGNITKSNISKIYVNGVEMASETSIFNVFTLGELHHVAIVINSAIEDTVHFNYNPNTLSYGPKNLYNNIIVYENGLDGSDIQKNYNLWIGRPNTIVVDSPILIDEKTLKIDDVDWIVVQSS